mgnify:FL=1
MPPGGPVPGSAGLTESAQAGLTQTEQAQTDPVQTGATAHGPLQSGLALGDVTQSNLARDALAQTGLAKAEPAPAADGETTQTAMRGDVQGVDKSATAEAGASK